MIKKIIAWYKKPRMSAVEKYLAQSTDLVDLERRQRELNYKLSNKLGYWV